MNVTIHYYGQLGHAVGRLQEMIDCPDSISLQQLLQRLVDHHGESMRRFVFNAQGEPSKSLMIAVNDTLVNAAAAPTLQAGDEVVLLPPISGG